MNTQNSKNNVSRHNPETPLISPDSAPLQGNQIDDTSVVLAVATNPLPQTTQAAPPATATPTTSVPQDTVATLSPDEIHIRAGSLLARLTADQRTQLLKWLVEYKVADVTRFVAAPPPDGFGIETHTTTLRRIKASYGHAPSVAFETSAATAEVLTETIHENRPQFAPLISELLLQKAFDQAADIGRTHDLKDLINSAIKLRELELKVQRLELLRQKQRTAPPRRTRVQVQVSPPVSQPKTQSNDTPKPTTETHPD